MTKRILLTLGIDGLMLLLLALAGRIMVAYAPALPGALLIAFALLLAYGYAKSWVWRLLGRPLHRAYWPRTLSAGAAAIAALWLLDFLITTLVSTRFRAAYGLVAFLGLPVAIYLLLPWLQLKKPRKGWLKAHTLRIGVEAIGVVIIMLLLRITGVPQATPTTVMVFAVLANAYNRSKL